MPHCGQKKAREDSGAQGTGANAPLDQRPVPNEGRACKRARDGRRAEDGGAGPSQQHPAPPNPPHVHLAANEQHEAEGTNKAQ